ncbi:outer membrane receptor protein [Mycolicibacterium phlei]|nr:outer membrane receptor protein [Mycolicibacterium phlei]
MHSTRTTAPSATGWTRSTATRWACSDPPPRTRSPATPRASTVSTGFRLGINGIERPPSRLRRRTEPQQPHPVVHHQRGDRPQRDAGERQTARVPGEIGDTDDQRDGRGHLVDRLGEVHPVGQPDADAQHADQAVEHHGRTAQHAGGDRRDHRADLGAQRQQDRDHGRHPVRRGRVDPGRGHHADVLGVRRGRRTAAETGQRRGHAVGRQRAAHHRIHIGAGHLAHRLHMPDVLGDQRDHRGQEHRQHRQRERRRVELRQPHPRRGRDRRRVDLAERQRQQIADHHRHEDRQPADQTAEERQRRHQQHQGHRRDHRALLEVPLRRRRQVEPDQRDDGAGHHRRQRHVDPVGAREVHHRADRDQRQPHGHQAAEGAAGALRRHRRGHRCDHREARAQIARQPVTGDQQEQDRADAGEQQRRRGWEAGQHRYQERGPEHRDHMLGAQADGAAPAESFIGCDDEIVVRFRVDALPGQLDHGVRR